MIRRIGLVVGTQRRPLGVRSEEMVSKENHLGAKCRMMDTLILNSLRRQRERQRAIQLSIWCVGDESGGGTPGPIPNPVVKPTSADGTALDTGWKSTRLPTYSN